MTSIRIRGINRVTAKGRVYYYHRATGKRIRADPSTPLLLLPRSRLSIKASAPR